MLHPKLSTAALTLALAFTACSKKEEPAAASQSETRPESVASEGNSTAPSAPARAAWESSSAETVELETSTTGTTDTTQTPSPVPAQPAVSSEVFEPAELRTFFPPFYPLPLRMEGIEGRIDLRVKVSETGEVEDVSVLNATAPQFRDYAVEAAKLWKFTPARQNGKPIGTIVTIPVPFVSEFGSGGLPPTSPLAGLTYLDGSYYTISSEGRYTPANQELTPLVRRQPSFSVPEGSTEPLRATLMFTVTEEGQVKDPKVVETTNAAFGEAALEAVRFWQFVPRIKDGKPVSGQVQLPIVFGSDEASS